MPVYSGEVIRIDAGGQQTVVDIQITSSDVYLYGGTIGDEVIVDGVSLGSNTPAISRYEITFVDRDGVSQTIDAFRFSDGTNTYYLPEGYFDPNDVAAITGATELSPSAGQQPLNLVSLFRDDFSLLHADSLQVITLVSTGATVSTGVIDFWVQDDDTLIELAVETADAPVGGSPTPHHLPLDLTTSDSGAGDTNMVVVELTVDTPSGLQTIQALKVTVTTGSLIYTKYLPMTGSVDVTTVTAVTSETVLPISVDGQQWESYGLSGTLISASGDSTANTLRGGLANDLLRGRAGDDILLGHVGSDRLIGGPGADSLWGGADGDELSGGGGWDYLVGGAGNDELLGGAGLDILIGGAGDDTLSGNGDADAMGGGTGNDELRGGNGNDTLDGEEGNDLVRGGAGTDFVTGGAGTDTLDGGGDNDTLSGGDGDDTVEGDAGNDQLSGDAGNDTLVGGDGADTLDGGQGDDSLVGGLANDDLSGGSRHDMLSGEDGLDTLNGGSGNDTLNGGRDEDLLIGGNGDDSLRGLTQSDTLQGDAGADTLDGGNGHDDLSGGADGDLLLGQMGSDTLDGGDGADTLTGGADADTFVFTADGATDTVTDFEDGVDIIDLDVAFAALTITDVVPGEVHVTHSGETLVILDPGGTLTAADLSAADFI